MTLGIDRVVREIHEAHVILVRREPPPALADVLRAEAYIASALKMSRGITGLMRLGIFELAPLPAEPNAIFTPSGEPTSWARLFEDPDPVDAAQIPSSDDPHIRRQRLACAREVMNLIEECGTIPAVELMNNLSKSWDRDKIVRPVMKRLTEAGVLDCTGNTRGAVYSMGSKQTTEDQDKTGTN